MTYKFFSLSRTFLNSNNILLSCVGKLIMALDKHSESFFETELYQKVQVSRRIAFSVYNIFRIKKLSF